MSIEVKNITKVYGQQKALDNVSFEAKDGEIVGFLGPNGAGKSTMMKILTCYIPPSEGIAKVCGMEVMENSLEIRKLIGYLPEHNPLYLDMYVKEYLAYIGKLHSVKNLTNRVAEMIDLVGLQIEQKKKIGQLSKGYRQRVGLAQAMIHDPKVLILDEPTTGLDPNQLVEIRSLIRKIGKEKTVMLSTHIMQEVEAICDRVTIINAGKIVADSLASDLKQYSGNQQVVSVEFDKKVETKLLMRIKGVKAAKELGKNTYEISSIEKEDLRPLINHFARENQLEILTISKTEKKLEDIFKELTT